MPSQGQSSSPQPTQPKGNAGFAKWFVGTLGQIFVGIVWLKVGGTIVATLTSVLLTIFAVDGGYPWVVTIIFALLAFWVVTSIFWKLNDFLLKRKTPPQQPTAASATAQNMTQTGIHFAPHINIGEMGADTRLEPQQADCPPVLKAFRNAYEIHKGDLGSPVLKGKGIRLVNHEQHQKAEVFMFSDGSPIYVLYTKDNKVEEMPDRGLEEGDEVWYRRETAIEGLKVRKRNTPPQGQNVLPPYGPVAKAWVEDTEWEDKIGWLKAHARYEGAVYRQIFDRGMMIGPVRHLPTSEVVQKGRIFVLLKKDGRWDRWEVVGHDKKPPYLPPQVA